MKKYSICMAYHHRAAQLYNTLLSYRHWYSDRTFEVIIVEDPLSAQNKEYSQVLRNTVAEFPDIDIRILDANSHGLPSMYNQAVGAARYDHTVLTCPEILHVNDVLGKFDVKFEGGFPYHYLVASCWSATFHSRLNTFDPNTLAAQGIRFSGWYQNSAHRNKKYHFCSAMLTRCLQQMGPFCREFDDGIAFEDDDFVEELKHRGVMIMSMDEPRTAHQGHPRVPLDNYDDKWGANRDIFHRRNLYRRDHAGEELSFE